MRAFSRCSFLTLCCFSRCSPPHRAPILSYRTIFSRCVRRSANCASKRSASCPICVIARASGRHRAASFPSGGVGGRRRARFWPGRQRRPTRGSKRRSWHVGRPRMARGGVAVVVAAAAAAAAAVVAAAAIVLAIVFPSHMVASVPPPCRAWVTVTTDAMGGRRHLVAPVSVVPAGVSEGAVAWAGCRQRRVASARGRRARLFPIRPARRPVAVTAALSAAAGAGCRRHWRRP